MSYIFTKKLGYYRTDDASDGILLSDGRREMADSEFGTGSNAEMVILSWRIMAANFLF